MAGMNFEYDERGGTFYYVLVSFYALILIPLTYYVWPRAGKKKDASGEAKTCKCEPCLVKDSFKRSKEPWKKWKQRFIVAFLLIAWAGFFAVAYKAAHIETDQVEWDPYGVLGLDRGASMEEVKKAYRQLTRKHHPDKGGDEKRFVEITKAHLALTDEESKKNFDLYGNPDGPGAQTFGIALPSWLVSKEYSFLVLIAYALVFMVILPVVVGVWWYRSIRYSADSVLMKTTELFFHMEHKTSLLNIKRVLAILSGAFEFSKFCNKEIVERPSDDMEVPLLLKAFPTINENKRDGPLSYPYSVKARALVYAHLSRRPLPADTLHKDLQYVLKKSSYLIQEMIHVYSQLYVYATTGRTMRMPALETLDNIMRVSALLVQAMWESKNALLQLPHITDDVLRRSALKKKRYIKTCTALAALTNEERREAMRGLSDRQYQDVLTVLASMPRVEMDVIIEVKDDEDKTITAGALVTAVVKLKRYPLLDLSSIKTHTAKTGATNFHFPTNHVFENDIGGSDLDDEEEEHEDLDENGDPILLNQNPAAQTEKSQPASKTKPVWEKNKKKKGGKNKTKHKVQQNKKIAPKEIAVIKTQGQEKAAKAEEHELVKSDKQQHSDDEEDGSSSGAEDLKDAIRETKETVNEEYDADEDDLLLDEDFNRREKILEAKSKITHLVHCPYFPGEKYEWWWVYICDRKNRQLICPPVRVTSLVFEEEVELRFPAQRKPGVYCVQVCLRSDAYVDCDISKDIKYSVAEAKQITSHPQWEFAEDDEDKKSEDAISEEASEYTEEDEDVSD